MSWAHLAQNREFGYPSLNRKTGRLEREQQPLLKKIKLILLFNPITEWIDTTHAMRLYIHNKSVARGREEERRPRRNRSKLLLKLITST